jgi:error-prone DNA polymerase
MAIPDDYSELHAHSNFSFLDGASHPEELIARAAMLGMPALAITDHAGLYAAVRVWKAAQETETDAAREAGLSPVRPIIGLELTIPRTDEELRRARRGRRLNLPLRGERASRGWPGEHHAGPMPGDHLLLLARDVDGYTALSRLVSRGHLAGEKQFPVFERALVEAVLDEARGHLLGLSGCRNGEIPRLLLPASATRPAMPRGHGRRASTEAISRSSSAITSDRTTTGSSPSSSTSPRSSACRWRSRTRSITPIRRAIGSRTSSSASATVRRSRRRVSSSCRTPSFG